jgi:hypothetical protein
VWLSYEVTNMAGRKKKAPPRPDRRTALSLSPQDYDLLTGLSQHASDELGRIISSSAVIRALLHHAGVQGPEWIRSTVVPLIEQELRSGVKWGKPKG